MLPRDNEGTPTKIEDRGQLRVGMGPVTPDQRRVVTALLIRIATATHSKTIMSTAASEEGLFAALEEGRLDLVVAEIAEDSPWRTEVAVIEPLAYRQVGDRHLGLSAAARNGENRWVMLVEGQVRDLQGAR